MTPTSSIAAVAAGKGFNDFDPTAEVDYEVERLRAAAPPITQSHIRAQEARDSKKGAVVKSISAQELIGRFIV